MICQPDLGKDFYGPRSGETADPAMKQEIGKRRLVPIETILGEKDTNPTAESISVRDWVDSCDAYRADGRSRPTDKHFEQRCLAAACRPDNCGDLPISHLKELDV